MKLNEFAPPAVINNTPATTLPDAGADVNIDEDASQVPEVNDVIRTKKSDIEGKVERVEGRHVFFRLGDGRLMKTSIANATVIEQLADEEEEVFEDEEELDEVSNEVLTKYKAAAGASASAADKKGDYATGNKRFSGIVKATKKQFDNDAKKTPESVPTDTILNDIREKWENTQLNELSTGKMQDYKAAASSIRAVQTRPLRKLAKSVHGVARADGKIQTKQDDAVRKKTTEADFSSILKKQEKEKANLPVQKPVVDIDFHGWTIRYRPAFKAGDKVNWMIIDKKGEQKHRGSSPTDSDAVADAEQWITDGGGTKTTSTASVTIDFNVNFAKEFAPGGEPFFAKISSNGNSPLLILSYEAGNGLKNSHLRTPAGASATRLPTISMTSGESNNAGLQPNGRYVLGAQNQVDDNTYSFPLIFQGIAQSSGDKMRMGKPGLIVAHAR